MQNTNKFIPIVVGLLVAATILWAYNWGSGKNLTINVPPSQVITNASNETLAGERGGLQEFFDGVTTGDITERWVSGKLKAGEDYVVIWSNTLGKDVTANYGEALIPTGETASSTSKISLFATTSTSVNNSVDFGTLAEGKRALIQAVNISTSTTATTTSSTYAMSAGKGNGSVLIPAGSVLMGYLQKDTAASTGCGALTGACESATSTNRGFNPLFRARLHYSK